MDFLKSEITSRFGFVKRARGCFLYTDKGIRLTDLYREEGRAVLGWKNGSSFMHLKNVLNKGITGNFNTIFDFRLKKAVCKLLNSDRKIYVFYSKKEVFEAASSISPEDFILWQAWKPEPEDWKNQKAVILLPPFPWAQEIYLLCVLPEIAAFSEKKGIFYESQTIPAPLCAAFTRSIYDMIAALKVQTEKDWFIYDKIITKYWFRKGPYLFPKMSRKDYCDFVIHCLECEIVISPEYDTPSIVPFGVVQGVFEKLKKKPFIFKEEKND